MRWEDSGAPFLEELPDGKKRLVIPGQFVSETEDEEDQKDTALANAMALVAEEAKKAAG